MTPEPEPEDPILSFKKANMNAVQQVLDRAQRKAAHVNAAPILSQSFKPGMLTLALDKAMAAHGRTASSRASIRRTAKDTGGRPYHFSLTHVTKGKRIKRGSKGNASVAAGGSGATSGKGEPASAAAKGNTSQTAGSGKYKAKTREGAHQAYTERDGAVGRDQKPVDATRRSGIDRKRDLDTGLDKDGFAIQSEDAQERSSASDDIDRGSGTRGPTRDGTSELGQDAAAEGDDVGDRPLIGDPGLARRAPSAGSDREDIADRRRLAEDWIEDTMRDRPGLSPGSSEAAAQAYVEDPAKVARVRGTTSSFGTIGDTTAERMAFWDLVHEHESSAGGRTQSRLVLELPHEATAAARHEIVKRYVEEFEDKGIPYWATIHVPTKRNDSRNYHAHVVFTGRPMRMMEHPKTGERVWDFTAKVAVKDATRHTRITHPHRQNRDPEMRDRGWVKKSRSRFADIVNKVMAENALGVRYDPRSYKDMGLDVAPMKNVDRILTNKSKTQRFVVMDPEWTRRMIDAEMREAALRRDETYLQLRDVETRIQEAARQKFRTKKANEHLPRGMAVAPGRRVTQWLADKVGGGLLEIERDRLSACFLDEAIERTLAHIIEATGPKRTAKGEARIARGADAPDPEALTMLHVTATEELAAFRVERDGRDGRYRRAGRMFLETWKRETRPAPSPAYVRAADEPERRWATASHSTSARVAESQGRPRTVGNGASAAPPEPARRDPTPRTLSPVADASCSAAPIARGAETRQVPLAIATPRRLPSVSDIARGMKTMMAALPQGDPEALAYAAVAMAAEIARSTKEAMAGSPGRASLLTNRGNGAAAAAPTQDEARVSPAGNREPGQKPVVKTADAASDQPRSTTPATAREPRTDAPAVVWDGRDYPNTPGMVPPKMTAARIERVIEEVAPPKRRKASVPSTTTPIQPKLPLANVSELTPAVRLRARSEEPEATPPVAKEITPMPPATLGIVPIGNAKGAGLEGAAADEETDADREKEAKRKRRKAILAARARGRGM